MSCKKYTFDDFYREAKKREFELISGEEDYQNSSSLMKYICPKHRDKGVQQTTLGRLLEGKGCYYCGFEKTASKRRKLIGQETIDEIKGLCYERDFEFVKIAREQINNTSKICVYFICNKHKDKGIQIVPVGNFRRNKKCQYCIHKNLSKVDIEKMVNDKMPQIKILTDYTILNDDIEYCCTKHNYYGHTTPANLIKGRGCYYCGLEKLSKERTLSLDEIDNRIRSVNADFERIGEYTYSTSPMKIRCNNCGYTWDISLVNLRFCPNCEKDKMYKGEHIIFDVLQEQGIDFETQKKFNNCRNIRPLPFDFYLPKYNTCIEYNGLQHYKPVDYFGGEDAYKQQVKNDNIKKEYCEQNEIGLITVSYKYDTKEKVSHYILPQLN